MAKISLTGVEITGQLIETFNHNITVPGSGIYSGVIGVPSTHEETGVGFLWVPDTLGDKIYFEHLFITLGVSYKFETEGSGTLTLVIRAIQGLQYDGQTTI